ncbi:MAG: hypothetical protein GXO54_02810 [Chloroflexi bacterium]|nr:hypothetical protein [Chloroflexota bacterium]
MLSGWFYDFSIMRLAAGLGLMALWAWAGWALLAPFAHLSTRSRWLAGWGVGMGVYLVLLNGLAYGLPWLWAIWVAAALLAGLTVPQLRRGTWRAWLRTTWQLKGWLILALLIWGIAFGVELGLLLFDEYMHLTLISTLAAGYFPPHNAVWPGQTIPYHYAFSLLAAVLARVVGLLPWTAYDLTKALVWTYALGLAMWFAFTRLTRWWARVAWGATFAFAGGARYLLLLVPRPGLRMLDQHVDLLGPRLIRALLDPAPWGDLGPPWGWPFAFLNGIRYPGVMTAHAGPQMFAFVLLLLLWALLPRARGWVGFGVLAALAGLLALAWEVAYVLLWLGAAVYGLGRCRGAGRLGLSRAWWRACWAQPWLRVLALSAPLALLQGGVLTHFVRAALTATASGVGPSAFQLRWPPAVLSAQWGPLPLTNLWAWPFILVELGPTVLFAPWVVRWAWRASPQAAVDGPFAWSAIFGLVLPVFVRYQSDHAFARVAGFGVWVVNLLLVMALVTWVAQGRRRRVQLASVALALVWLPGVVIAALQLSALQRPRLGQHITLADAAIAREVWNALPRDALVFDPLGWPVVVVTGRPTWYGRWFHDPFPEHQALVARPELPALRALGFTHVYVRAQWLETLPADLVAELFEHPCTRVVAQAPEDQPTRWLLEIRACSGATRYP